ncbi:MAG: Holliday junction resolvase RuvX [Oscillospiraceae bacterium]|nr:Holliday junction resolvase RuvX [Oscillospiraceae bacterium]
MIIMSVDLGEARTGIAVCDKSETIASPVKVISEYNAEKRLSKVAETATELKAELIVVGLPKNMDGSEGERAKICREFSAALGEKLGVKVDLCDERVTTMLAHTYLSITNVKGRKRKNNVDAVSAVIILENYLSMRKNSTNF